MLSHIPIHAVNSALPSVPEATKSKTVFTVNPIVVKCQSSSPASPPPPPFLRIRSSEFLHQLLHLIKKKYTHQVIPSPHCHKTSITNTATEKKICHDN